MADLMGDQNLPSAGEVSEVLDETGFTEEERAEILKEIDTLVSQSQPARKIDEVYLRPRRSGVLFPVLINVIAVAAIAGGIYFISRVFQQRQDTIALESRTYFSAEAQIIQELLRESEEQLAQKDQEINQIQSQLAQLDQEKQNLEANLESQVAEREAELRAQLDAELAAERQRLAGLGQSEETINARLAEIEAQRRSEFSAELDAFRAQAQAELEQLERELAARETQLEQTLAASREERSRIASEAAAREAQIREELGAEIAELEEAEQEAQARISELQALREEETLLTDRVLGSFAVIVADIQEGLTEEALRGLESLERLLRDQTSAGGERDRRRTELALVETLRGLVREVDVLRENIAVRDLTTTGEEAAAVEQQRAAELIRTAAGVIELAEEARGAGRVNEARTLYQQALSTIPSLEQVYPGILDLESTRRRTVLQSAMSEAQSLLAAGSSEAAITRYLGALTELAAGEDDPLVAVAAGIRTATAQNQQELLAAQQDIDQELQAEVAARDQRITALNQQLLDARNQVSARDATITELRTRVQTLNDQLAARQESISASTGELTQARQTISALQDDIAAVQTDLQAAQSRSASLQASLDAARARSAELSARESELQGTIAGLNGQVASLQGEVSSSKQEISSLQQEAVSLRQQLETRPAVVQQPSDQPSAATQARIDELDAKIAELNATVDRQRATVAREESARKSAESQLESVRGELRAAEAARDTAQTDLAAAEQQVAGLERRISDLQSQRDQVSGESSTLATEITQLEEEVASLEQYRDRIRSLSLAYSRARTAAVQLAGAGNYESARTRLLQPLLDDTANEILPGVATTLDQVYAGLITQAENRTSAEVRADALADVTGLTEQVKKNIDNPQESAAVESYLRREPDIAPVADAIFEIVELASRDISAPEVEYRLLGSVSRVTGNLVVVERLVALATDVGDSVELRRTPQLGQEVPVAAGTVLEVTDRRVVVSVDEIYQIDVPPAVADLVYIAQE